MWLSALEYYVPVLIRQTTRLAYIQLLHKPRWCSASWLFVFHTVPSFTEIIRKLVYSLSCSPCNNCSFLLCSIVTYIYNHLCLIGGISCYVYFNFSLSLNFLNYGILCILYMGYEPAIDLNWIELNVSGVVGPNFTKLQVNLRSSPGLVNFRLSLQDKLVSEFQKVAPFLHEDRLSVYLAKLIHITRDFREISVSYLKLFPSILWHQNWKQLPFSFNYLDFEFTKQEVKVIWQKAPHGGPIPRLGVTPRGRKLYHWIPGVGFPISVP